MDKEFISTKVRAIVTDYTDGRAVDCDADLMASPTLFAPHVMASLFLDIEAMFSIDLNELVPKLNKFSLNELIDRIWLCVAKA